MIEILRNKFVTWFNKERRMVFFTVFVIGMLVHFSVYSNELLAYDAYWHYGSFLAKGWEISLGRFLIPFVDLFRGTLVSSILTSTISILTVSFTTLILTDLLRVKKTYIKILMGILLVVTPTFSLTLMYAYTGDSYTFALLFAVLSVYFLNSNHSIKNIILSIISIIFTLGFYQAYLCVIVTLCVIVYLIDLCTKKDLSFKKFFKKVLSDIAILFAGIIIYYICFMVIVKMLGLSVTDYNGGSSILSIETIKNLLPSIKNTYITFFQFHFGNNIIESTKFVYRNIFNILMLSLIFINFIILIKTNKLYKAPYKLIFMLIILLMFPIFSCIIEVIAQKTPINLLMASALYLPLILLLKQIELLNLNKINILSLFIVFISLWTFVITDNATYTATNLYNKQMYALGNRIIERLDDTEEITQDTPICIAGKMDFSLYNSRLLNLTNFDVSKVNIWTWQVFLQDNLALGRNICTMDTYENIINSEEFYNMELFPSKNSIKMIDGVAVVKIGY